VRRERKQRKKERKMIRDQVEMRVLETCSILRQTGALVQIETFYQNDIAFCTFLSLFLTQATTVNQQLQAFQDPNQDFQLHHLDATGRQYLGMLAGYRAFIDAFFANSIVTFSDNDS
jgi:hypothetical protein